MDPFRRLLGPAPSWPRLLDAALERWARLPARGRVLVRAAALVMVVIAATGGLVRGPWGPPTAVLVATVDLPPGGRVTASDLRLAHRPAGLVPDDALRDPSLLPATAVSTGLVPAGTVVTSRDVAAGLVPASGDGVVVPLPADALPALPIGTRLDLAVASYAGTARVVARGAQVVADDGTWRWVLIERAALDDVALGVTDGSLVPAVLPPAPRSDEPWQGR